MNSPPRMEHGYYPWAKSIPHHHQNTGAVTRITSLPRMAEGRGGKALPQKLCWTWALEDVQDVLKLKRDISLFWREEHGQRHSALVCQCRHNKKTNRWVKQQKCISHRSEGWNQKSRCWQGWCLLRPLFSACRQVPSMSPSGLSLLCEHC